MYTEQQWSQISSPLSGDALTLIHRHWLWANQQREWFRELRSKRQQPIDADTYLSSVEGGAMVVWYGLLWAVIEALHVDRGIEFGEPLGTDIVDISDPLRRCRHAVLHVPRKDDYFDKRILELMAHPDGPRLLSNTHRALGRLLLEEIQRRMASQAKI